MDSSACRWRRGLRLAGRGLRRDFTPAATNALMLKDLELLTKAADAEGLALPLARHMQSLYEALIAAGEAGEDFFSVVKSAAGENPAAPR